MECPKCDYEMCNLFDATIQNSRHVCQNESCKLYRQEFNLVNPDDILNSFWDNTYLIHLTSQNILFVVNADCEQDAIDEMIDYIESMQWEGLLLDYNDPDDLEMIESGNYICGGNHGRYLSTYHIRIEKL